MATIEAMTGGPEAVSAMGAQKAKGSAKGMGGQAGSFMAVLMQLLGQDFSPEEIKKLESLVIGGIKKGKAAEGSKELSGKETAGDETGSANLLAAALILVSAQGSDHAKAPKTGGPDAAGPAEAMETIGTSNKPSIDLADRPELKHLLKVLQGGKAAPETKAAAPAGAGQSGSKPVADASGEKALRNPERIEDGKKPATTAPAVLKPEEGEITLDLNALRALLQKESAADSSGLEKIAGTVPSPETATNMSPLALEKAVSEQLSPLMARAAASGGTDTISIRVKDGEIEKKFTLRKNLLAARQADSGADAVESAGKQPIAAEKSPERIDPAGLAASVGEEELLPQDADRPAKTDHGKILIREMMKPAGQADAKAGGNSEFSNVLVKYVSTGPDGGMEKVFYKEIETPGVEKKTLLIKTETIQTDASIDIGQAASGAGLSGNGPDLEEIKPQTVISQVAEGAESALKQDFSRVRMELNPPRLGTLDMDLLVSHDRVKMIILADSQDVRNILQGNMDQLRTSLEQQGLKMDGVDVFVQDRYAGGSGDPGSHTRDGGRFHGTPFAAGSSPAESGNGQEAERAQAIRTPHPDGNTGLSIFA